MAQSRNTKQAFNNRRKNAGRSQVRSARGAGMAEGTTGLLLVFATLVGGVLLLVNVAMVSYYQDKLGLITNHAAAYAASICSWNMSHDPNITNAKMSEETLQVVRRALKEMNLTGSPRVNVERLDAGVKVTVAIDGLLLAGEGNLLPATVSLTDMAVAPLNNDEPPMVAVIGSGNIAGAALFGGNPDSEFRGVVPAYGKVYGKNFKGPRPCPAQIEPLKCKCKFQLLSMLQGSYSDSMGTVGNFINIPGNRTNLHPN